MNEIDYSFKPDKKSFIKEGMDSEEYLKALSEYRKAKKRWHKRVNKNPEMERNLRNKRISKTFRKMKASQFNYIQEKKKPIKSLREFQ